MEFFEEKERICVRDESGTVVAEVVFPEEGEDAVCITRTYVEEGLRGQGIAAKLMEAAANSARRRGKKIIPQCSRNIRKILRKGINSRKLIMD